MLKTESLSNFYDKFAIEGLRLAAIDAQRGALDRNSLQKIRVAVEGLVADLSQFDDVMPSPSLIEEAIADESERVARDDRGLAKAAGEVHGGGQHLGAGGGAANDL